MRSESQPITEEQANDIERYNQSQLNNVGYEWVVEEWDVNRLKA